MEYLILGILTLSPMTGYELQQFIKQNLALICSHSAGSVQTALTKLEKSGTQKDFFHYRKRSFRLFSLGSTAHASR